MITITLYPLSHHLPRSITPQTLAKALLLWLRATLRMMKMSQQVKVLCPRHHPIDKRLEQEHQTHEKMS